MESERKKWLLCGLSPRLFGPVPKTDALDRLTKEPQLHRAQNDQLVQIILFPFHFSSSLRRTLSLTINCGTQFGNYTEI
jgi:hypothetical protein